MSFPRYPKYKASGVEWFGEVPEGWEVKRSDSFLTYSRDQLDPKAFQGLEVFHYSIPVVQETGTGQIEDGAKIASGKQIVKKKVVLVSKLNPRKGTICIAEPQPALTLCSTEFVALEPNGCDIRYLSYLVRSEGFRQGLESKVTSVTNSHQRANPVDIYRFWNAWPVLPEQTAIAEFLDRETAKIDGLVAEQRRLMELLKEKRQGVISHAVTKGLNPRAPMKPSGVEWLGDVPRHWEVWKLTHSFKTIGSGTTPKTDNRDYYENGVIPWVNTGDLNDSFLADCENKITGSARKENPTLRMYPAGSVVIAMYGATIGKLAILKFAACVNQACCVFADREKIDYKFLFYWLLAYRSQIISLASGGGQPNISQDILRRLRVARPALEEQNAIVAYVDRETLKYERLTDESLRTIDLLLERRSALISAAVTGQIDVRNSLRN